MRDLQAPPGIRAAYARDARFAGTNLNAITIPCSERCLRTRCPTPRSHAVLFAFGTDRPHRYILGSYELPIGSAASLLSACSAGVEADWAGGRSHQSTDQAGRCFACRSRTDLLRKSGGQTSPTARRNAEPCSTSTRDYTQQRHAPAITSVRGRSVRRQSAGRR